MHTPSIISLQHFSIYAHLGGGQVIADRVTIRAITIARAGRQCCGHGGGGVVVYTQPSGGVHYKAISAQPEGFDDASAGGAVVSRRDAHRAVHCICN
jgi:hypothetical protein